MKKITAVIAALGFLATTSLTPVMAAASIDAPVKNEDLSSAKKKMKGKKKMMKKKKKISELAPTELSAAKMKKGKKKMMMMKKKKMSNVIEYRIAA